MHDIYENNKIDEAAIHFLPELQRTEIKQLQVETANKLNLNIYFSDSISIAGKTLNGPELAVIPSGQYEMGSTHHEFGHRRDEYPQHYSKISKPFAIGRYPVTAEDFDLFMKDTEFFMRPDLIRSYGREPLINIRMPDAYLYLEWLSEHTGEIYRLPTESEWEYAARAGTTTAFCFGDEITCKEVHFHSLFPYNEAKEKKRWYLPRCSPIATVLPVGDRPTNDWGLHDVHGNVWEFTDTPWRSSHLGSNRDGNADNNLISDWMVTKGGSWFDEAIHCRSASRKKRLFDEMDTNLGFRVVREI